VPARAPVDQQGEQCYQGLRHEDLPTASRYIDRRGASSRALDALES
jgi:hypothetical protein